MMGARLADSREHTIKTVERPRGDVKLGTARTVGGTISNARSVVARLPGRFRACYNRALQNEPGLKGALEFTVVVDSIGAVASITTSAHQLAAVMPCLKAVVRSNNFAPPTGQRSVNVVFSATFTPR